MSGSSSYVVGVRINGDARGLSKAAQEALRAQRLLSGGSIREYQRMAEARSQLGVRSEREVRREIQQTEAAYNRLARSGTLSWQEQRMAAKAMREEVTRLTNEMGRMTTRQKLAMGAKGVAGAAAGIGIAAAIAAPKVQKALDYDTRLVHLANTAYNDRDTVGRAAGMRDLNAMIVDAVRYGGGTRDSAVGTAEQLFGAGIFKPGEVQELLREAMRAGSASNAEPEAFAQMAITASQTMGIKPANMGRVFGMGTYAGQAGGFEIKDMAKWLPQQMAAAKAVGLYGEAGFAKLAALNQAAVVTAGTRDEAGNNVVNLLAKLGSQDTNKDFRKQGIDLPKELAQGRMRGEDAIDVLGGLLQGQLSKDKNYAAVQRQLTQAKSDPERQAALEAVGGIAQGTVIGKVFQDRQALMGLYGYMQNRDRVKAIEQGALKNPDASQRNFDLLASQPGFKVQQAKNEAEIAQQQAMDRLTPAIGSLADKTAALVKEYPGMTTAVIAATGALVALAGSAAAAAAANWLMARRGLGPVGSGPLMPPSAGKPNTPFPKIEGASGAGAAAAGSAGLLAAGGTALAVGGAAATTFAANMVASNPDAFTAYPDDYGFAAGIINAARQGAEEREAAKAAAAAKPKQPAAPLTPLPPIDVTASMLVKPPTTPIGAPAVAPTLSTAARPAALPIAGPAPIIRPIIEGQPKEAAAVKPAGESVAALSTAKPSMPAQPGAGTKPPAPPAAQPGAGTKPPAPPVARPDAGTAPSATPRPSATTYTAPPDSGKAVYQASRFGDPRVPAVGDTATLGLADRLAKTGARDELKGEIVVRVIGAPGLNVSAETKSSNPGVTLRADVGNSMRGSGH